MADKRKEEEKQRDFFVFITLVAEKLLGIQWVGVVWIPISIENRLQLVLQCDTTVRRAVDNQSNT